MNNSSSRFGCLEDECDQFSEIDRINLRFKELTKEYNKLLKEFKTLLISNGIDKNNSILSLRAATFTPLPELKLNSYESEKLDKLEILIEQSIKEIETAIKKNKRINKY